MKVTLVFVLAFAAVALAEKYTDKYDTINYHEILENDRLSDGYIKCLLDKGACTAEGKELKSHINEALANGCAKCTKAQQDGTRVIIKHLINKKADSWSDLKKKYDPKGIYTVKYESEYKTL
ncbi:allergen Tha p 1-like [Aricia agestis]|uniref:allergen Tha p 1-like n=1 Tax=Aricia agestis TaxID=91739 RepID=UPI001C207FCE|nr:allergen Tha p 1-like [Aricia agestis]XP_041984371.1 allergen Tha p 1-like [Aricia agestis]